MWVREYTCQVQSAVATAARTAAADAHGRAPRQRREHWESDGRLDVGLHPSVADQRAAAEHGYFQFRIGGHAGAHEMAEAVDDGGGVLAGDQAAGDVTHGQVGDDGVLAAAGHPVDLERRSLPQPLDGVVARFAERLRGTHGLGPAGVVEGDSGQLGPPLGGAAVGLLGPVTTVIADAVSYLLSAAGVAAIRELFSAAFTSSPLVSTTA